MNTLKARFTRLGLDALYYSKTYHLFEPRWSGVGVIFTLHHVRAVSEREPFRPNAILEITPSFLDATIQQIIKTGVRRLPIDHSLKYGYCSIIITRLIQVKGKGIGIF